MWLGYAKQQQGDLAEGAALFSEVVAEAEAAHDVISSVIGLAGLGWSHAYQGDAASARSAARAAIEAGADFTGLYQGIGYSALAIAMFAAGDVAGAADSSAAAARDMSVQPETAVMQLTRIADAAIARGDLATARRLADEAVPVTMAWPYHAMQALIVRARVAIAHGELEQAERDAHDALACGAGIRAHLDVPDILECLARVATETGAHREAVRLFGAAAAARNRMGAVRLKIYDGPCEAAVAALCKAMGRREFDQASAEGAALSTEEAIAYAQRGRGERRRPPTGWASLTPTERDVVRLVREGLGNNDIAKRLFVSPRTVQSHLTHVYAKLGLTSRTQLAHEASRHP